MGKQITLLEMIEDCENEQSNESTKKNETGDSPGASKTKGCGEEIS